MHQDLFSIVVLIPSSIRLKADRLRLVEFALKLGLAHIRHRSPLASIGAFQTQLNRLSILLRIFTASVNSRSSLGLSQFLGYIAPIARRNTSRSSSGLANR